MAKNPVILRYARGGAVAFEFTGTIAGGAFCGWYLDSKLQTAPWLLLLLTVLGAVGGFFRLIRMVERFNEIDRDQTER